jgi:hypothetical protein
MLNLTLFRGLAKLVKKTTRRQSIGSKSMKLKILLFLAMGGVVFQLQAQVGPPDGGDGWPCLDLVDKCRVIV